MFFSSSMFVLLLIITSSQLKEEFNKYAYECFYILDQEDFFLGNSEYIHEAPTFRTEERSKIISEKIYLSQLLKNKDEAIEYYI